MEPTEHFGIYFGYIRRLFQSWVSPFNEPPAPVKSILKLFADDSKLYIIIQDTSDVALLQKDLDTLVNWTDDWLLRFNVSKCKVMHCGHSNLEAEYFLNEANGERKPVEVTRLEKDLGIYVPETLKPTLLCSCK